MPLAPDPDPEGQERSYGFSTLFTEAKLSLAALVGGPIAGLFILHRNFLELREFDRARRTLVLGAIAIAVYYPLLYWLSYRYFGKDLPAYAKIIPPLLLEAAFIAYQKGKLAEFLDGGAVRQSLFAAARFILAGLALEGLFYGAALKLMPNMRGEKVVIGKAHHELYYEGMDGKEAAELAGSLASLDHLQGPRQVYLKALGPESHPTLLFPEARDWADLEVTAYYSLLLDELERKRAHPVMGCFFHDAYGLTDTSCFTKASVPLLAPLRNRKVAGKLEVLAKIRGEVAFFRALFEEAERKGKRFVAYERVPTLFIFAVNGIATVGPGNLTEALSEAYGNRENAILGTRILAYAFQGLKWPRGDNLYSQYVEALDLLQGNLDKVAEAWTGNRSPEDGDPP